MATPTGSANEWARKVLTTHLRRARGAAQEHKGLSSTSETLQDAERPKRLADRPWQPAPWRPVTLAAFPTLCGSESVHLKRGLQLV